MPQFHLSNIKLTDAYGNQQQGFLLGKANVDTKSAVTIPRLELCAAVLGIEIANIIKKQISIQIAEWYFVTSVTKPEDSTRTSATE